MTDILFPDFSNYQANADIAQIRQACGAVAMETNWGTADTSLGRVAAVREQKFDVVIWYMGLVASQGIQGQVSRMASIVGSLQPGEIYCLDWEETNGATPSASETATALDALAQQFQRDGGLYASASLAKGFNLVKGEWLWVASYETPEPAIPHALWQYTDGQYTSDGRGPVNWPGLGLVDTSVFHGEVDQMQTTLNVVPFPAPAPGPVVPTDIGDNVQEAEITLPGKLDANGNGWYTVASLNIQGLTRVEQIDDVVFILGTPTQSGYTPIARWGIDGNNELVIENGVPGGQYGVIVKFNA